MIRFIEGFDNFSTGSIVTATAFGKWDSVSATINNANPRFTSNAGQGWSDTNRTNSFRNNFKDSAGVNTTQDSGILAVGFNPGTGTYPMNIFVLYDSVTFATVQMGLKLNADLTLSVFRTDHSTVLGTTTFALTAGVWHFIEFKWKIANSIASGDVVVRVNGDTKLTVSAASDTQNTANANATGYGMSGNVPTVTGAGGSSYQFDDFVCMDLTGGINDNFLGEVRVITLRPSGNGNTSNFTGSDGNSTDNYLLVDETGTPNSDTDYVESSTLNHKDTYAYGDLPSSSNTVYCVQLNTFAKRTDANARTLSPVVRHSGTDNVGSAMPPLVTTYFDGLSIYNQNPGTAAAWTVSDVNAAEFGYQVTT